MGLRGVACRANIPLQHLVIAHNLLKRRQSGGEAPPLDVGYGLVKTSRSGHYDLLHLGGLEGHGNAVRGENVFLLRLLPANITAHAALVRSDNNTFDGEGLARRHQQNQGNPG